ncbi:MAG: hypothetical protein KAR01_05410 [Desulfocapsa sp.]|nr:hypothetical protein [Desulfocapsa sp.]
MDKSKQNMVLSPIISKTGGNKYLIVTIVFALFLGIFLLGRFYLTQIEMPSGWNHWPKLKATFAIVETDNGVLVGSLKGLFLIHDDGSVESVKIPGLKNTQTPPVNALLIDKNGALWVGHNLGLSVRINSKWTTINESDGIPHHSIACLTETPNGFIWAGTLKGAVRLSITGPWNQKNIHVLTTQEGLLDNIVLAVLSDNDRGIWFGNYAAPKGGLSLLNNGGQWQHWTVVEGLPHPNVTSLMIGRSGRMWVGCGLKDIGGAAILKYEADSWVLEKTLPTDELTSPKVRYVFEDNKGRYWLGAEKNGFTIRSNSATLSIVRPEDGLPAGEIMYIIQSSDGAMWLGTSNGPIRISPEAVEKLMIERVR